MLNAHGIRLMAALLLAGCSRGGSDAKDTTGKAPAVAGADTGTMRMGRMDSGGMGMSGMHEGMQGMGMMPMMRAHMDSIQRMSPAQMQAMMAMHQDMMARMMDNMGADMRTMHMSEDTKWNTLVDSVKADLADLTGLKGEALAARVKAHAGRVERLMAMHEGMMK